MLDLVLGVLAGIQGDNEFGSFAWCALYTNPAAMHFNNGFGNCQAQPSEHTRRKFPRWRVSVRQSPSWDATSEWIRQRDAAEFPP